MSANDKQTPGAIELVAAVRELLDGKTLDTRAGASYAGINVRALILTCPSSEERGRVDAPLTITALSGKASALEGMIIQLVANNVTAFGRINGRGQLLFRGLEPGEYRVRASAPAAVPTLPPLSIPRPAAAAASAPAMIIPPFPIARPAAAAGHERMRREIRAADGSFKARLYELGSGEVRLRFVAMDPRSDGSLIQCGWKAQWPDGETEVRERAFAVLSEFQGEYVAELTLGSLSLTEITLCERPAGPEVLSADLAADVRTSVRTAATDHSRAAWRRMAKDAQLPAEIVKAIEEGLSAGAA